jgi:hypothetical protein
VFLLASRPPPGRPGPGFSTSRRGVFTGASDIHPFAPRGVAHSNEEPRRSFEGGKNACDTRLISVSTATLSCGFQMKLPSRVRCVPCGKAAAIAHQAARSEQWREPPSSLVCSLPGRVGPRSRTSSRRRSRRRPHRAPATVIEAATLDTQCGAALSTGATAFGTSVRHGIQGVWPAWYMTSSATRSFKMSAGCQNPSYG